MIDRLKTHKFKILGGLLGILVFAGAIFGAYRFGQKQVQPGPQLTPTPAITCGSCPQFMPPHPDFCKDGTIVPGEKDKCGCQIPPSCEKTSEQKVFCQNPRPEVCTMECVAQPSYICGSDGKFYCNKCAACANPKVEWYLLQETPCEE
ncbi:hypothetical protein COT65_02365 [Candidatus Shapirobacteria bacterium CG09_land_8_20_14_0_10_47_13]|uniref:Kazal-like domain-containing protein n=1 Tax=Candidatus Shapirobacteria bacterium CG09_land_8_20_14_0_10_47_13 TaxID=1974481 RepID=A0A2H0WM98_9BACT|nr:MAG: hypothetical protein COT65_02365 [Candidatus Shapirobacteria bacterium CG09_land_8_20_14_0_10_47_13]